LQAVDLKFKRKLLLKCAIPEGWGVTAVLLGCYCGVTGVLLRCYWGVTGMLLGRYCGVTVLLLRYYWGVTAVLLGCYCGVTGALLGCNSLTPGQKLSITYEDCPESNEPF